MKLRFILFSVLFFLFFLAGSLCAERVKSVESGGTLKLENGEKILLAGILLNDESSSILSALVAGKDVELDFESRKGDFKTAYLYVQSSHLPFPFSDSAPKQERVLINRFLLDLGAAVVDPSVDFAKKGDFLKAQETAKTKGEGVWSYDTTNPSGSPE